MGYTVHYTYEGEIDDQEWEALVAFAKSATDEVDVTTCEATDEYIDINGSPGCENLVLCKKNYSNRQDYYAVDNCGNKRAFCKTDRLPYGDVVVAVLIAAQQVKLVSNWQAGSTEDVREAFALYYRVSDAFQEANGRWWWLRAPTTHAAQAAKFHTKWKELEPDLMNLAVAAQALASLRGGSTTLVQLMEELNDILVEEFDLRRRPFSEDP